MNAQELVKYVGNALAGKLGMAYQQVMSHIELAMFSNSITFLPATTSGTSSGQFLVQADSAFCICKTMATVLSSGDVSVTHIQPFGAGPDLASLPFTIQQTDNGAGRAFENTPVPLDSIFGSSQRPYEWPIPHILDPNSQMTASLTNLDGTSYNVRLVYGGYKIFGTKSFIDQYKRLLK